VKESPSSLRAIICRDFVYDEEPLEVRGPRYLMAGAHIRVLLVRNRSGAGCNLSSCVYCTHFVVAPEKGHSAEPCVAVFSWHAPETVVGSSVSSYDDEIDEPNALTIPLVTANSITPESSSCGTPCY
jgi:hypothetical protein